GLTQSQRNAKLREMFQAEQNAKLAAEEAARAANAPKRASQTRMENARTRVDGRGETYRGLDDPMGREVKVYGQGDRGGATTPGHAEAMNNQAERMAESGLYVRIYLQRSWRTATGEARASSLIPDVIGIRRDGSVDAFEVPSITDIKNNVDLAGRLDL